MPLPLCELRPAKSVKPRHRRSNDAWGICRAGCPGARSVLSPATVALRKSNGNPSRKVWPRTKTRCDVSGSAGKADPPEILTMKILETEALSWEL
jgi:hypothetical protein